MPSKEKDDKSKESVKPRAVKPKAKKKSPRSLRLVKGQAHIQSTYNNTLVTIADLSGNVIAWSSAGKLGFKGPKKATPFAAGKVVADVLEKVKPTGLSEIDVLVNGIGSGREAAVRALESGGLTVTSVRDVTPVPHNGVRPPGVRRV